MDYIAHYEKSPRMWSQGLHAHDDYEIYLHLNGGRFYCIDDTVFKLTPNQLLIIPPLHMHGFFRNILKKSKRIPAQTARQTGWTSTQKS